VKKKISKIKEKYFKFMAFDEKEQNILNNVKNLILTHIITSESLLKAFAVADFEECNEPVIKSSNNDA
jgi:hypothetical protein